MMRQLTRSQSYGSLDGHRHLREPPAARDRPRACSALSDVEIAFSSLRHIDHACMNLLRSWQKLQEGSDGHVRLDWNRLQALSYKTRAVPRRHDDQRYGLPVLSSANRVVFRKPEVG